MSDGTRWVRGKRGTYGWVVVREGVVNGHVFEEPSDVLVEEAFDFCEIVFRVDEDGADVGFDNVRESLVSPVSINT